MSSGTRTPIIYQLHVKAFADSNDDGIGDFAGLTEKLDYLQDLGVTALWLLPFYPSPGRDDGYDIADYGAINPDFGTMKDFRRFMAEAKRARPAGHHRARDQPHLRPASLVQARAPQRAGIERAQLVRLERHRPEVSRHAHHLHRHREIELGLGSGSRSRIYWHRFFSHQPDLNFDNPRVLQRDRAGDAALARHSASTASGSTRFPICASAKAPTTRTFPRRTRSSRSCAPNSTPMRRDKVLLAEANQWPEDVQPYFGDGDECHMAYHFPLMPRIYMAIAQEDRFPIADILRQTPDIPANCQWALFLRNHDELTLEMVTDVERDYLWSTYATDPRARINLGIRRRLAPLMDNDRRKIELMNSLLMSLPGTPIIYYGDEIGMGDNIYLGDRNGVRTPMQWTPDRNGGFSRCDPARLYAAADHGSGLRLSSRSTSKRSRAACPRC